MRDSEGRAHDGFEGASRSACRLEPENENLGHRGRIGVPLAMNPVIIVLRQTAWGWLHNRPEETSASPSHHLTQKEIGDILLAEYDMSADRKSIRRNIDNLIDMGYDIEFSKCTNREVKNAKTDETETTSAMSSVWLAKDFEDSELRLIIDGLLCLQPHSAFAAGRSYRQAGGTFQRVFRSARETYPFGAQHLACQPTAVLDHRSA